MTLFEPKQVGTREHPLQKAKVLVKFCMTEHGQLTDWFVVATNKSANVFF